MTSPQAEPPAEPPPRRAAAPSARPPAAAVAIEDEMAPRIRLPADALRCGVACIGIALLVGLGLLARKTVTGIELNVVGASQLADKTLLAGVANVIGYLALVVLLILPVALGIRMLVRRHPRRLAEAAGGAAIAVAVVIVCNLLLRQPALARLHVALTLPLPRAARPHAAHAVAPPVLNDFLAGLAAYVTVAGLAGRRRWQTTYWVALGLYVVASLADSLTAHITFLSLTSRVTLLSLLISLLIGSAVGSGLRYAYGTASERPTAAQIAAVLSAVDAPVTAMRRLPDAGAESRRYAATIRGGERRDVRVFDRDQQGADVIVRLYRRLRLKNQVSRTSPLTLEQAVERRALLTYAVEDAGVPTPRLRALARIGSEAAALANDHHEGTTLAGQDGAPTDDQLRRVWDTVLRLRQRQVAHRRLTADRILFAANGDGSDEVMLLDPGEGNVAASDLQLRLDLTQLLAESALLAGPERAADIAAEKLSGDDLAAMVPLLQPAALHRSTRMAIRQHKEVLPELRKRLLGDSGDTEIAPVQLTRFRPRTVITMVAVLAAAYILLGQVTRLNVGSIKHADWRWAILVLVLSALTYVGATFELTGFVLERLNLVRVFLAQVAGSFVTLVAPAAVGGVALNIRFLRKAGVSAPDAAAGVGASQVIAFGLHILLLVIFAALTGASHTDSLRPPTWVWIALAALVAVAAVATAIPAGRRLLRSRLAPALGQVIPRLLDVAQQPAKLATGIGGALLLTIAYIACLYTAVRSLGGTVAIAGVAVVYLTGSAVGSIVPTPGGIGAVEAALTAGLTAAGMPGAKAVGAVLLFRMATFYLPVPVGWAALNYLQRHDAL